MESLAVETKQHQTIQFFFWCCDDDCLEIDFLCYMPDSFFTSTKPRKRKRSESSSSSLHPGPRNKFLRKSTTTTTSASQKTWKTNGVVKRNPRPRPRVDEELSDRTDDEDDDEGGGGGVDDMELRVNLGDDEDLGGSGEEDENETPAEKRLRLARLYLESVKDDLGERPKNFWRLLVVIYSCVYWFFL